MVIDNGRPGGETEGVKTRWGWWLSRRRRLGASRWPPLQFFDVRGGTVGRYDLGGTYAWKEKRADPPPGGTNLDLKL